MWYGVTTSKAGAPIQMSPVIDLIRFAAAMMVCLGHAESMYAGGLASPPPQWMQQAGVNVFFLLSGYLISQTLNRRLDDPTSTFWDYAIDRWSRIYSAFLPALLLVAMIDWHAIDLARAHSETVERFTLRTFAANLLMLQAPDTSLPFGSAAPFWTVAIEFWIYMFVGLVAFSLRDGFTPWRISAIALCGIIPVSSLTGNNMVLVPWLLGASIALPGVLKDRVPALLSAAVAAVSIFALHIHLSTGGAVYTWKVNLLTAAAFAGIIWTSERVPRIWSFAMINAAIAWGAS